MPNFCFTSIASKDDKMDVSVRPIYGPLSPQLLEVRMQCEFSSVDSPDPGGEQTPTLPTSGASSSPQESEPPAQPPTGSISSDGPRDNIPCLQYGK